MMLRPKIKQLWLLQNWSRPGQPSASGPTFGPSDQNGDNLGNARNNGERIGNTRASQLWAGRDVGRRETEKRVLSSPSGSG